jgi:putative tricarboxylic transport membrane protein
MGSGTPAQLARIEPLINMAWIAAGAGLCVYARRLGVWGSSGPDSGFFPMIAGALVLLCGVLLLLLQRRAASASEPFWPEPGSARRVCALVAGLVALVLLVRYAGLVAAAIVMMPILLRLVEKRSWPYAIVVGLVATAAVHTVFVRLLGMVMPRGPWGF